MNGDAESGNGWDEHKRLVLKELGCLRADQASVASTLVDIRVAIGKLQVKAGIWGILGGCVPIALALAAYYIRGIGSG